MVTDKFTADLQVKPIDMWATIRNASVMLGVAVVTFCK